MFSSRGNSEDGANLFPGVPCDYRKLSISIKSEGAIAKKIKIKLLVRSPDAHPVIECGDLWIYKSLYPFRA